VPATPRYVAIIADGNRRWATSRGLPGIAGHDAAADTLKARLRDAAELGIRELTVFAFSTENWARPDGEVGELMRMFARRIALETPQLHAEGVRMRFLGGRDGIPAELAEWIARAEALTAMNETIILCIAFNYGGRAEIVQAATRFIGDSEEEFRRGLYASDVHDPQVIIRTGGEQRLSNFLLWQSAYAELVFCEELWPDFTREVFEQALLEFTERDRRFGGRVGFGD
jgi:undecaprenyl diphosphate synthase